jgi:hypothetical protein
MLGLFIEGRLPELFEWWAMDAASSKANLIASGVIDNVTQEHY